SKELSGEVVGNAAVVVLTGIIVIPILYLIGVFTAKLFHLKEPTKSIHAILSSGGNVVFLGYPIIHAIFGPDGLFYAVLYGMVNDALFWTVGVYFIYRSGGTKEERNPLKTLFNPNTVAFIIAIPLMLLKVKIPPILNETLSGIGEMTTYLSMLFIGMTLSIVNVKKLYQRISMLLPMLIKMVIAPIVVGILLVRFGAGALAISVIMLQIAMPAQTATSIVAMEANSDEQYAAEYIFFSTIISLGTLPLVYYIMEKILS
ncbi:MAG: AEC family transporter, partial [Clostridia bacterium]|nr:AEC family transporter [Clostridia bacterium]